MNEHRLRPTTAVAVTADLLVLARFMPDWAALTRDLSAPRAWVSRVGVDAAAITTSGALLWLAACWMALGLLALLASVMPGRVGEFGLKISRRALPAVVRRIVVGAAGISLAFGPVPALAEGISSPSTPSATSSVVAPVIAWPADHAAPSQARTVTPSPPTAKPAGRPTPSLPPPAHRQGPAVTVKPGESLWLIAAHRLGPTATDADIAAEWPRWYAANRTIVGDDPALLRPGQQLTSPSAPTAEGH
jgi:resuscitation-promoting factor RpfA